MPQIPRLIVPDWHEHPSGLLVPSSVADRIAIVRAEDAEILPPELRRPPEPLAVVDRLPVSADQLAGIITEEELGIEPSTRAELEALVAQLPFEYSFLFVARLQAKLWHVREDAAAQIEIVRTLEMPDVLVAALEQLVAIGERAGRAVVVFGEQYLTLLERVLVEKSLPRTFADENTIEDFRKTVRAIFAAATVAGSAEHDLEQGDADREDWLLYTLKNLLYNVRPALVNSFTRARELFVVLPAELREHEAHCDVDQWFRDELGLSVEEQHGAGFAAYTLTKVLDEDAAPADLSLISVPEWRGRLAAHAEVIEEQLTGDRAWFQAQFAALPDDAVTFAWERRPFLRRPFLKLADGRWLLIAPRMLENWLGDGFYYRALEIAQARNESLRFTRFFGALVERYCLDLARSVYAGQRAGDAVVRAVAHGEIPYGPRGARRMTSDVAIDLGVDLVLIEVVSARLTAQMQVAADRADLAANLERMLFKKIGQLGKVSAAILAGEAEIPDVDPAHVERIWPIVVTAGELAQTELLWDAIEARTPEALQHQRIAPLSVFDLGDFETLLGLVAEGRHLPDILAQKNAGPYRRLDINRFLVDELHYPLPLTTRPPILEERWRALFATMNDVLGLGNDAA